MFCPFCINQETKVVDKRDQTGSNVTRRRRECETCGKRFTTYERIENIELYVKKKSGKIEEFNRDKIKRGIVIALVNRDVSEKQIDDLINQVEQQLLSLGTTEISSAKIGDIVLARLRELDPLGYLRFASVYNAFKTMDDFKTAIVSLESQ